MYPTVIHLLQQMTYLLGTRLKAAIQCDYQLKKKKMMNNQKKMVMNKKKKKNEEEEQQQWSPTMEE
ncbi:hypothetical protein H5410_013173 [Solanum commersonii]|uniref:Uncharacterized protein n=1 Tax=Solanum commersonii TaxID=4109 RepID=A0A9J6AUK1_SOLCO|nr:hypothetical protein H5410_013173 [Solanum commersonii]